MKCISCREEIQGNESRCPHCGWMRRSGGHAKVGLGDLTGQMLAKIGVTEGRYKEAKRKFGLLPTCGCESRRRWLNKVTIWYRDS